LFGLLYSWSSVKWIKQAYGQPTVLSELCLERVMDTLFAVVGLLFVIGIVASVWFFVTWPMHARSGLRENRRAVNH
jgi:hypothetical protein